MSIAFVIDDLVVIQQFVCFLLLLPRCECLLIAFDIPQASR